MKRKIIGKILVKLARVTRQGGFSTMQVVAALAIAGIITAGAAAVLLPAYQQTVLNSAFEEITVIANATRQVREYNGNYTTDGATTAITAELMVNNGYLSDELYSDGLQENRLGNNFTIVSTTPFDNATITYLFDSDNQCLAVAPRVARSIGGLLGGSAVFTTAARLASELCGTTGSPTVTLSMLIN